MSWLDDFVEQHKNLESPRSFWWWAGIATISAVVKDNIWMDRQIFKLYPNIYVMFHADSGLKKGPPVSAARQMVKAVNNTHIISGRSSIQGILKEMGRGHTQPGGKVVVKSVAFICSSELSSSIVEDKVATKILTDLYDRQYNVDEWKSLLKMEEFQLEKPTITMLTATNEAMGEDFFTKAAIQGGYFARTFIIYEKQNEVNNSLIFPMETKPDYATSAVYLKQLAALKGEFKPLAQLTENEEYRHKKTKFGYDVYFNDVGNRYDEWYEDFRNNSRKPDAVKDTTGTLNRFGDSVLKVAMLLSLAEKPELEISLSAMNEAITQSEKLIGNVNKTTYGKQGLSQAANIKSVILNELLTRENHIISRKMLMQILWGDYESAEEFDGIMLSLDSAGMVLTENMGNQIVYRMPMEQVRAMQRLIAGKLFQ